MQKEAPLLNLFYGEKSKLQKCNEMTYSEHFYIFNLD